MPGASKCQPAYYCQLFRICSIFLHFLGEKNSEEQIGVSAAARPQTSAGLVGCGIERSSAGLSRSFLPQPIQERAHCDQRSSSSHNFCNSEHWMSFPWAWNERKSNGERCGTESHTGKQQCYGFATGDAVHFRPSRFSLQAEHSCEQEMIRKE